MDPWAWFRKQIETADVDRLREMLSTFTGLVKTLGIDGISKSQVSAMAKSLDPIVEAFRNRPLDAAPYRYVWINALVLKCREGGRIVNVALLCATGVSREGQREILGMDVV